MRKNTSGFTFSLTTLGTVALIVACSSNNKLQVTQKGNGADPAQSKVMACSDSLSPSVKRKISNKTVSVCENAEGAPSTAKPVATEFPVSYSVEKEDGGKGSRGKVRLTVNIGFTTTETLTEKQQELLIRDFTNVCGADTQAIFNRTNVDKTPLDLNLNFSLVDGNGDVFGNPSEAIDQIVRIVKGADGSDSVWVLDQIPSRPRFYPQGKEADNKACAAQFPADPKTCIWQKRHDLNVPACAAFAKRVGNSLGIVDAETEANTCGATQAALLEDAAPAAGSASGSTAMIPGAQSSVPPYAKPTPTQPGNDGSSSFAKPRLGDGDFLKRAELNRKDVIGILSPVCPSLKDAK